MNQKWKKQINNYSERKYKYKTQKSILNDRNSYSKISHDTTFMWMKKSIVKDNWHRTCFCIYDGYFGFHSSVRLGN